MLPKNRQCIHLFLRGHCLIWCSTFCLENVFGEKGMLHNVNLVQCKKSFLILLELEKTNLSTAGEAVMLSHLHKGWRHLLTKWISLNSLSKVKIKPISTEFVHRQYFNTSHHSCSHAVKETVELKSVLSHHQTQGLRIWPHGDGPGHIRKGFVSYGRFSHTDLENVIIFKTRSQSGKISKQCFHISVFTYKHLF